MDRPLWLRKSKRNLFFTNSGCDAIRLIARKKVRMGLSTPYRGDTVKLNVSRKERDQVKKRGVVATSSWRERRKFPQ